jgi:hypothetical protein
VPHVAGRGTLAPARRALGLLAYALCIAAVLVGLYAMFELK